MNPYLPDNCQDNDPTAIGDEVFDLACTKNNTNTPTEAMLREAEAELTEAWERFENEGRYL